VMEVHGGPVWLHRPLYLGAGGVRLALLRRGYAVLLPNPRGSSGRGQDFASKVFGDMGGADTQDYLSGIDELVERGLADPKRLGVTGGSYGGFMSAWLVTRDSRFAAAVPVAPVTNWVSEHLTCHIPHFCAQFLDDSMTNPGGKYHTRSPIMYASRVRTPTLLVCGALDRNTPPGQAVEFHHAVRLHGAESVLVTYPQEGHGVRSYPAVIDFSTRVVGWFEKHMPGRGVAR
jgi:dipeptidyl aminopeptidase/acylaminoacyl peptidase